MNGRAAGDDLLMDFFKASPLLAILVFLIFAGSGLLLRLKLARDQEAANRAVSRGRTGTLWGLLMVVVAMVAVSWWLTQTDLLSRLLARSETLRTFDVTSP